MKTNIIIFKHLPTLGCDRIFTPGLTTAKGFINSFIPSFNNSCCVLCVMGMVLEAGCGSEKQVRLLPMEAHTLVEGTEKLHIKTCYIT